MWHSGSSSLCVCMLSSFSHVRLCVTLWFVAPQAPLSMEFSRQEYWSGLPCPPLGNLPDPGIKPLSLMSPALAGGFFTTSATWEAHLVPLAGVKPKPLHWECRVLTTRPLGSAPPQVFLSATFSKK